MFQGVERKGLFCFLIPLHYFRQKYVIFDILHFRPDPKMETLFQTSNQISAHLS